MEYESCVVMCINRPGSDQRVHKLRRFMDFYALLEETELKTDDIVEIHIDGKKLSATWIWPKGIMCHFVDSKGCPITKRLSGSTEDEYQIWKTETYKELGTPKIVTQDEIINKCNEEIATAESEARTKARLGAKHNKSTCPDCKGSGQYIGFSAIQVCDRCKGEKVI